MAAAAQECSRRRHMDIFDRKHEVIEERQAQMELNWLCYKGGQKYIDRRLMRGVHEDDVSWKGKPDEGIAPRRLRTCYVPYAERVVDKIEEQIWSKPIKRDGAAEAFTLNADRTGQSVDEVLQLLQEYWTVCGWGWLGIDRTGGNGPKTVAEKEKANDCVYWTAYAPWEVVDWHYGKNGRLEWALTERSIYNNADPFSPPVKGFLRTLWRPGEGIRYILDEGRHVIDPDGERFTFSCPEVPFVRLGEITKDPHWFDNVEGLACKLMNLDSEAHANLSKGVYSLPVVPSEVMERSQTDGLGKLGKDDETTTTDKKTVIQQVYGRKHPIMEDEASKGITRFVSPPSGDLTAYPNEIERTKKALYEVVGLGLSKQKDTADAESADAKQWDHLDINAVLRERALSIQRLEVRAVKMSLQFDREFPAYDPVYPTEFNIGNPADIIACAKELHDLGVPLPKALLIAMVRAIAEMIPNISEKERLTIGQQAEKALEEEDDAIARIAKSLRAGGGKVDVRNGVETTPSPAPPGGGSTPPPPQRTGSNGAVNGYWRKDGTWVNGYNRS